MSAIAAKSRDSRTPRRSETADGRDHRRSKSRDKRDFQRGGRVPVPVKRNETMDEGGSRPSGIGSNSERDIKHSETMKE